MQDNSAIRRRTVLRGGPVLLPVLVSGCLSGGESNEIQDSDGDGVIDSEDYAPSDPDVQEKSDVQSGDSRETATPTETPEPTETETETPRPQIDYPSHTGAHTITASDNYWAWEFEVGTEFLLKYRVANLRDENYDFDVLLYGPAAFQEYHALANEIEDGARPAYIDGSAPGVRAGVRRTVRLPAGRYYLVVDNTDLSDAGDWGTEATREVRVEASTSAV